MSAVRQRKEDEEGSLKRNFFSRSRTKFSLSMHLAKAVLESAAIASSIRLRSWLSSPSLASAGRRALAPSCSACTHGIADRPGNRHAMIPPQIRKSLVHMGLVRQGSLRLPPSRPQAAIPEWSWSTRNFPLIPAYNKYRDANINTKTHDATLCNMNRACHVVESTVDASWGIIYPPGLPTRA